MCVHIFFLFFYKENPFVHDCIWKVSSLKIENVLLEHVYILSGDIFFFFLPFAAIYTGLDIFVTKTCGIKLFKSIKTEENKSKNKFSQWLGSELVSVN